MNQRIGCLEHLPGRGAVNLDPYSVRFFRDLTENRLRRGASRISVPRDSLDSG